MSQSAPAGYDGRVDTMADADEPELSPTADDDDRSSSDEDTVKGVGGPDIEEDGGGEEEEDEKEEEEEEKDELDEGDEKDSTAVAAAAAAIGAPDVPVENGHGNGIENGNGNGNGNGTRNGIFSHRYRELVAAQEGGGDTTSEDGGSTDALPRRVGSPIDSLLSVPDDSPSIQGSVASSQGSSLLPSRPGLSSPTPSFRPFDRRFQSRMSSPSLLSPRSASPAFMPGHSRNASLGSQLLFDSSGETETTSPPWEVVRWTRLNKLNGQAFSEAGKRNFGSPTCMALSASIVLGTSKGIILIFDYNQNLKMIVGPGTKAVESGPITSIAVSADHTTVAGGHANGSIFTWDTSRASRPFLSIPHLDSSERRSADGHIPNVAVTHLGFLGTRHTALVSADDRGMAFSHLATRGTGPLGRTVKTTRILGRYPDSKPPSGKPLKPSTVLAFAPLPLGNVEMASDTMGLTAMLTPYLLVIVSTTPIAQTQHKSARPREVAAHSAMTGCLAWFPAVKLKVPDPNTGSQMSKVKLVYCWSNVLTVLDVDEIPAEDKDKPASLSFRARSRWKCEESIAAVQWLSRSVLTVLTVSQRLIVLEDRSMRMTEAFDLIHKHIYHVDLFSRQLHSLVEQLDEEDTSMHGVVADAFYMSFKAYKGRLFLLGFNEVSIGALSNWADRLIALMENGDYIGAIQLATSYYTGDADKLTVGLPEDTRLRHSMVRDKLMEIMTASLKYAFGQRQKRRGSATDDSHLRDLAETCFTACQGVGDVDFVFEEMYEWYEEAGVEGIFLEVLEPYILDRTIASVPPTVVKTMVAHFVSKGLESRLEEMICHMDTMTLDLDQITQLCKRHNLYDALIYVWNEAMRDYITPLIDLLALLVPLMQNGGGSFIGSDDMMAEGISSVNAVKMFPYLSYILTGRVYPTGDRCPEDVSTQAKAELYWFLFSGKSITWPRGGKRRFLTRPHQSEEPSFPYLRMILKYDAASFLSVLNEAFEDSFLNDTQENGNVGARDLPEEQVFGRTVDRQYVVSILMEIMNPSDFAAQDTIYLDMFIARNMSKYPQYLLFPGSALTRVLTGLCRYPGLDLADDAQLSAEYLLSVYHPPDLSALMPLFKEAGFYRILKRIYGSDKQCGKLIQTYFEDPDDRDAICGAIADCLRPQSGLTRRQVQDVHQVIRQNARDLIEIDPVRAATTIDGYAPELHKHILDSAADDPELQYMYLKTVFEPEEEPHSPQQQQRRSSAPSTARELVEQYVQLMCRFAPSHVSDYVGLVQSTDLRLERLLPTMEETGVIDAAVVLMAREGHAQDAMARLVRHLGSLESALQGLFASSPAAGASEADLTNDSVLQTAAEEVIQVLQKYTLVGIWLCQEQTKAARQASATVRRRQQKSSLGSSDELTADENLWLELIDTSVQITRRLSATMASLSGSESQQEDSATTITAQKTLDTDRLLHQLRSIIQHAFTALLTSTSTSTPNTTTTPSSTTTITPASGPNATPSVAVGSNMSFLRILRAFLTRAASASPSLADLRAVLASVFAAYAYEEAMLRLSNRLLERSLFVSVGRAAELRQRGWRPKGSTCEACGRRVWGPGVQGNVFEAWERRTEERRSKPAVGSNGAGRDGGEDEDAAKGKGKERGRGTDLVQEDENQTAGSPAVEEGGDRTNGDKDNKDGKEGLADSSHPATLTMDGMQLQNAQQATTTTTNDPQKTQTQTQTLGPLVVLACRHIYHQSCLETLQQQARDSDHGGGVEHEREYRCPIDG